MASIVLRNLREKKDEKEYILPEPGWINKY
jgi:hypothetical protein